MQDVPVAAQCSGMPSPQEPNWYATLHLQVQQELTGVPSAQQRLRRFLQCCRDGTASTFVCPTPCCQPQQGHDLARGTS